MELNLMRPPTIPSLSHIAIIEATTYPADSISRLNLIFLFLPFSPFIVNEIRPRLEASQHPVAIRHRRLLVCNILHLFSSAASQY
jgi:hypothetical protein